MISPLLKPFLNLYSLKSSFVNPFSEYHCLFWFHHVSRSSPLCSMLSETTATIGNEVENIIPIAGYMTHLTRTNASITLTIHDQIELSCQMKSQIFFNVSLKLIALHQSFYVKRKNHLSFPNNDLSSLFCFCGLSMASVIAFFGSPLDSIMNTGCVIIGFSMK